ncbi:MAG TPA: HypC/HybG/HupF family hydrogenase formation chaperone [Candidatus Limnocylindrales bacterium]
MCRTTVGEVLSVADGVAVVDLDGVRRNAIALMVPDLVPGELVLVGLGTVLGRVTPADRAALEHLITTNPEATQ